jgi:hypothetical protein
VSVNGSVDVNRPPGGDQVCVGHTVSSRPCFPLNRCDHPCDRPPLRWSHNRELSADVPDALRTATAADAWCARVPQPADGPAGPAHGPAGACTSWARNERQKRASHLVRHHPADTLGDRTPTASRRSTPSLPSASPADEITAARHGVATPDMHGRVLRGPPKRRARWNSPGHSPCGPPCRHATRPTRRLSARPVRSPKSLQPKRLRHARPFVEDKQGSVPGHEYRHAATLAARSRRWTTTSRPRHRSLS